MRPAGVPASSLSSPDRAISQESQSAMQRHHHGDAVAGVEDPEPTVVVDVFDDGGERDEVQEPRRDTGREREPHEEATVGEGRGGAGWPSDDVRREEEGREHEDPHAVDEVPVEREHFGR